MLKKILCLSGGLDSTIAYHELGKPPTIFFDTKTYSDIEKEKVLAMAPDTIIDTTLDFSSICVDTKAFVPYRNLLFAARAADYADEIIIAGVDDDKVVDKTPNAFISMATVLNDLLPDKQRNKKVTSPFWGRTKAEIVSDFLENVENGAEILKGAFSCYTPVDGEECHKCPACFRKWNALWENGIETEFHNTELMVCYFEKALGGEYLDSRNASIIKAVNEYLDPDESKVFCFDIDGVLTIETDGHNYERRSPNMEMIACVNDLHTQGHTIILQSARWKKDENITEVWLRKHAVQYDSLILGKPKADYYIDDKMLPMEDLLSE